MLHAWILSQQCEAAKDSFPLLVMPGKHNGLSYPRDSRVERPDADLSNAASRLRLCSQLHRLSRALASDATFPQPEPSRPDALNQMQPEWSYGFFANVVNRFGDRIGGKDEIYV